MSSLESGVYRQCSISSHLFFQKNLSFCVNGENVQQQKIKKQQQQNNENGTVLGVAS